MTYVWIRGELSCSALRYHTENPVLVLTVIREILILLANRHSPLGNSKKPFSCRQHWATLTRSSIVWMTLVTLGLALFQWLINRTGTESPENNAAVAKSAQDKKVIMLYMTLAVGTAFTQVHHNFWTSEVVWSRLKSHAAVKWSQVKCDQVDGGRLGVILASSRVTFLYRSDSQV